MYVPAVDDDIGFDPFIESSQGLASDMQSQHMDGGLALTCLLRKCMHFICDITAIKTNAALEEAQRQSVCTAWDVVCCYDLICVWLQAIKGWVQQQQLYGQQYRVTSWA